MGEPTNGHINKLTRLSFFVLSIFSGSALGSHELSDWRFSGFGTLGYSYENEDHLSFIRDYSQNLDPEVNHSLISDSQLGAQISYRSSPYWDATVQLVAANQMDWQAKHALEWAYVAVHPTSNIDVRAGRIGLDLFALTDTRRVDYTHLWVRPPTEVYSWAPIYFFDGVDFSYAFDVEDVYYRAKFQYGVSQSQVGFANSGMTYDFKGEDFAALSLTAEVVDWTFRLTAGTLTVGTDLPNIERYLDQPNRPAEDLIEQFMMKGDRVQYFEAAAKFDDFNWTVLSELAYTESESKLMPNGVAGYLTVGKRVEAWTPYISAAFFDAKHSPFYAEPTSSELDKYAVAILNSARIDQRSITIGVRWDWTPQSALTLQWDHYFISKYGSSLWSEVEDEVPRDQQVDLFSIAIAFVF